MVTLSVKMTGEPQVDSTLNRLTVLARNLMPIWPDVRTRLHEIFSESFETEGASTRSGRFAPLSTGYAAWKSRHFPGRRILEATGRLRASLLGGPEEMYMATPTRLVLMSTVPYGVFHQTGTPTMPRRAPIGLTRDQARGIVNIISVWMRKDLFKGLKPGQERTFAGVGG